MRASSVFDTQHLPLLLPPMGTIPKAPSGYLSPSPVLGDFLSFMPVVKFNLLINHSGRITVTNNKSERLK